MLRLQTNLTKNEAGGLAVIPMRRYQRRLWAPTRGKIPFSKSSFIKCSFNEHVHPQMITIHVL